MVIIYFLIEHNREYDPFRYSTLIISNFKLDPCVLMEADRSHEFPP